MCNSKKRLLLPKAQLWREYFVYMNINENSLSTSRTYLLHRRELI
nr:MAG TPA: hypothetical protein [Caudoviricetes sp.]